MPPSPFETLKHPECALAAAFAKLPECVEARGAVRGAVQNVDNSWLAADNALAALAKWGQP